jgi:DNA-binding transcriptional MerR regulator
MQRAAARQLKVKRNYPDKLFYKIGEVSKIAGVEPYVLRYWESEFPFLKPRKSKSGQRIYVKKDLEMVLQIKEMLYNERYTIEGVRKRFGESGTPKGAPAVAAVPPKALSPDKAATLEHVKSKLKDILRQLQ